MKLKSLLWMPLVLAMSACGGPEVTGDATPAPTDDTAGGQVSASCVDDCGEAQEALCQPCPLGGIGTRWTYRWGCSCQYTQVYYEACGPTC
jgi:hypothetical protein